MNTQKETYAEKVKTCSICRREFTGWDHNAQPVNGGRCCDECNTMVVLPARLALAERLKGEIWPR